MFCCLSEASLLSSGRSVSPLQGRYGQSVREQALRSLREEIGSTAAIVNPFALLVRT